MTFPNKTFDAYVPSNGADLFAISNLTPAYIPFDTLRSLPLTAAHAESFAYAQRLTPPTWFNHVLRCFYFGLALLYTGFPSRTPGVPQIGFEELTMRLYHTTILHDVAMSNSREVLDNPAHGMTFELQSAFMAYEHLHRAAPALDAYQVGDIVQGITLHTSVWPTGNSSANQMLMSLGSLFDVGGYNGTGLAGLNFTSLWNTKTVQEIEAAYPRGKLYNAALQKFEIEFAEKPNCLLSHFPGGLPALLNDTRVGPIVPPASSPHAHRAPSGDPHLHHLD